MAAISALSRRRTFEYKLFLIGNLQIVRWLASNPMTVSFGLLSLAEPSLTTYKAFSQRECTVYAYDVRVPTTTP